MDDRKKMLFHVKSKKEALQNEWAMMPMILVNADDNFLPMKCELTLRLKMNQ